MMIKLRTLLPKELLLTEITFKELFDGSDPERKDRAKGDVNARSTRVITMDEDEAWTFNYKSNPSTTGDRWHGYVRFLKESAIGENKSMDDIDCKIECDCPDFRYRYRYNDAAIGASDNNDNPDFKRTRDDYNKQKPRMPGNNKVGMCKHLCALADFLKTKIDPTEVPTPEDEVPEKNPNDNEKKSSLPEPKDNTHPNNVDMRTGSDSDNDKTDSTSDSTSDSIRENDAPKTVGAYQKIDTFVKSMPSFVDPKTSKMYHYFNVSM